MDSKINRKSTNEQPAQSPTAPRKAQKPNTVNPEVPRNDKITVGGIGAPADGFGAYVGELQSINEELLRVNLKLRDKLDQILHLHADPESPMNSTEIATLFLDRELRIRHYTPSMQAMFNIVPGDLGHPIKSLTYTLRYTRFMEDAEAVLRTSVPVEREVQGASGEWLLIRIRPYRTADDETEGVIFTLVDITQLKAAREEVAALNETSAQRIRELTEGLEQVKFKLSQASDLFSALFDTNPIPTVLIRQEDEVFLNANAEFLNYFQLGAGDVIGHNAAEFSLDLGLKAHAQEELRTQMRKEGKVRNVEFEIKHPSGERRIILASLQVIILDETNALITTFIDITERVRAEQKIRALASELTGTEQAARHKLSQILHDDLQQRLFAVQMQLSFLRDAYEKNDLKAFQIDFPQVVEWLAEAIKVTRQLSVDLSPPILHGEGLVEAVIWLCAQMNEQYGLKVDIKANGTPGALDEKVRVLTFYAIRELLFNVVKHAGTLEAAIGFEHSDSHLLVIVRDRGIGFDSTKVMSSPHMAHGLLVIRDRLNLLGCKMEMNSQPGIGTAATIEIPYGNLEP